MRATRLVLAVAGLLAMAYALLGAVRDHTTAPVGQVASLAAVLIAHDGFVLPAAIAIGALLHRFVPAWARVPAQGALFVSATVTVVALPFVLGYGRSADLPSALPLQYGRGLAVTLAAIWAVPALLALRSRATTRRRVRPRER